ncbi:MAG: Hpt domain-containing protein [Candidatus Ozemobacteraceae bacterium]
MTIVRDEDWKYALGVFIAESKEMLDSVEPRIMHLETLSAGEDATQKLLKEIFRLFHSLKGGAATFGLNVIRDVTHQAENLLAIFRSKQKPVLPVHVDLMCKTCDLIRKCLLRVETEFEDREFTEEAGSLRDLITIEVQILEGKSAPAENVVPTSEADSLKKTASIGQSGQSEQSERGISHRLAETSSDSFTLDNLPELSSFETFFTPPHSNFAGSRADLNLYLTPTMLSQFVHESETSLAKVEAALESFDESHDNSQSLHEAFQEMHSFKGRTIFLGYPTLSDPAYLVENLIDLIRKKAVREPLEALALLIEATTGLRNGLECLKKSQEVTVDPCNSLISRLESAIHEAKKHLPIAPDREKSVTGMGHKDGATPALSGKSSLEAGPAPTPFALNLEEMQIRISPKMLEDFLVFSKELFDEADSAIDKFKADPTAIDKIEKTFRAIHGFTGTSEFFGFNSLTDFSRVTERVLHHMIKRSASPGSRVTEGVIEAIQVLRNGVLRIPLVGAKLEEADLQVMKRLNELVVEFRKLDEMAEFFPTMALLEDIFDPLHLKAFQEECDVGIPALEKRLNQWVRDPDIMSYIADVASVIHGLKSSAALLSSRAKKPLPPKHPLQFFRVVAHGAEMLVMQDPADDDYLMGGNEFDTLFQSLETLKNLRTAFFARESTVSVPNDLLTRLSINAAQFRETDLALMEACLKNLEHSPPDQVGSAVDAYMRSLRNLETACRRLVRSDVNLRIQRQKRFLEEWLATTGVPFASRFPELKKEYTILLECISAPPPAGEIPEVFTMDPTKIAAGISTIEAVGAVKGTLRVDEEKIDQLLRSVGELFVMCESFSLMEKQVAGGINPAALAQRIRETGEDLTMVTNQLEKGLMSIRMVPVRTEFQRFPRIVRDLARQLGKEVRLIICGDETEIEKRTLEQIRDPLVHIIRNSVDHGIELPATRRKAGKPEEGVVTLSAAVEENRVLIKIADDGKGLDSRVLKKMAVEKGLISADEAACMTESEAFNLIFSPGFSTAEKITDISGRGFGMDVVRNNITALQGTVEIESKVGIGSTFTLELPIQKLCLMIFRTILVRAGVEEYLIPMENVAQLVHIPANQIQVFGNMMFVPILEKLYPMAFLSRLIETRLPLPKKAPRPDLSLPSGTTDVAVVLVQCSAGDYALGLDSILGEERVVVKPLKSKPAQSPLFSGAAKLGDGRVSLVLEPINLAAHFSRFAEYISDVGDDSSFPAPLPKKTQQMGLKNPEVFEKSFLTKNQPTRPL